MLQRAAQHWVSPTMHPSLANSSSTLMDNRHLLDQLPPTTTFWTQTTTATPSSTLVALSSLGCSNLSFCGSSPEKGTHLLQSSRMLWQSLRAKALTPTD